MRLILAFLCTFSTLLLHAQTLQIKDSETKEPLEFVTVYCQKPIKTAISNNLGEVDLSTFSNAEKIEIRLYGYKTLIKSFKEIQHEGFVLFLTPTTIFLQQAVVSATRWNQNREEIPSKISTISRADMELLNPQTTADMLGTSGEVFIQKSQQGGGSPMIRGFSTNRLLYTVDGVRMNTAIYRSGNLHNVISLDPFAMENTEVFFGPGAIIYGSDAIGAVMSFQTLKPVVSSENGESISGNITLRTNSANKEKTGHVHIKYGGEKWAGVSSVSIYSFDDLKMGTRGPDEFLRNNYVDRINDQDVIIENNEPRIQVPSGYDQLNLMQKIRFSPNEKWDFQYAFHYSETSNFPRYDRLIRYRPDGTPRSAEWKYGPQIWMMNHFKISHSSDSRYFDKMTLNLAFQKFEESRIDRNFNNPIRRTRVEQVDAYSANLDFLKELPSKSAKIFYGMEGVINDVVSTGTDKNIETGQIVPGASRYPDSQWASYAIYASYQQKISIKSLFQAGLRYNRFLLNADFRDNLEFYPLPFEKSQNEEGAFNANLGWVFTPTDYWIFHTNFSTGFRTPNVDDIGKVFDSEPGTVLIPNPYLKPEYAYNFELNASRVIQENVMIDLTGYFTHLDNALVRRPSTLNGQDSIFYDGELSKVLALQNAAFVRIIGLQAALEIKFSKHLTFSSKLNIQKGREETEDGASSPSRHAPPTFGVSRLEFMKGKLRGQLFSEYSGGFSYYELPLEERGKPELYAIDENGNPYSPSWATLNLKGIYQISNFLTISGGIENITNIRYRTYSSGISAPGRNFILTLMAKF
ncbi:TonB-dependent receptor plug domain-containing protein [Shivajiella indica]|uniref:TonB-dependent receptor plug domain-containing protein n=1 Tax=Shivajiella indica TaxID=872115 RepID=A0ABW5B9B7_9BACT